VQQLLVAVVVVGPVTSASSVSSQAIGPEIVLIGSLWQLKWAGIEGGYMYWG
jgi:hypothetical protein